MNITVSVDFFDDELNLSALTQRIASVMENALDMARTQMIVLSDYVTLEDMSQGMEIEGAIQAISNTVTISGLSTPQVLPALGKIGVGFAKIRNADLTATVLDAFPPAVNESVHPTFILAVEQQAALEENSVWNFHTPLGTGGYEALVAWMDYYHSTEMAQPGHPYAVAMSSITATTTRIDAVIAFVVAINPDEPANTEELIRAKIAEAVG